MNRRQPLITGFLLLAVTLLFSGASRSVHEHLDHRPDHAPGHAAAHPHDPGHDHREQPIDQPGSPEPTDHPDDCSTCFLLTHAQASPLDFDVPPTLPEPGGAAAILTSPSFVLSNDLPLPPGRGPPSARL